MRRSVKSSAASVAVLYFAAHACWAQTATINGKDLVVRSNGFASGNAWALGNTAYVGTYITVPAGGGTVSFTLNAQQGASGTSDPHLNLVVADSKFGFNLSSPTATDYAASAFLPGGTYFVRTERDYAQPAQISTHSAIINSLSINGASFSNTNTSTNALAAADSYIANFRKGSATVALSGPGNIALLPGTQVNVDLKRNAFNFGTAVPGSSSANVNSYLGNNGTAQQTNYQAKLNQNFNAIVPENAGKWSNNEATRDVNTMAGVDTILNYAQANNQRVRMHNLIWGSQQPSWATTLLSQAAAGNATAKADLRAEISERIAYYVGTGAGTDRANKYVDLDLYNESYHTGSTVSGSYWNVYTPAGIADMYREAKAVAPNLRIYANEYNVYADGSDRYANWYQQHVESLRNAAFNAGYGDVVSGIGTQYYANTTIDNGDPNVVGASNSAHNPARLMQTLQNLSTEGLPITLTEFGVKSGASQTTAAQILSDALRITFGNANANGFMMWGFQAENGGGNLFAPAAALFNVSTSNWNAWTITEAGKAWQDLLGIQDWDGDPNDGWTTHVTPTVNPDGSINFTGFFGDYNIGNQSGFSNLTLLKGTSGYTLSLAAPPGWHFWNGAAGGDWQDAASWSNGAPDGVGQTAHFGSAPSPVNVNVAAPVTVGMINFDSANAYAIGGDATITMSGPAGVVAMNVVNGSHSILAPLAINDDLNVLVRPAASTLTITNLQPTSKLVTKTGAGALAVNNVRAAGLAINDGTVAVLTNGSSSGTSRLDTLSLGASAALDLNDNDLIVTNGSVTQISNLIVQARHGGAWDQPGITSSAAKSQASHATTLGVLSGAEYLAANGATFDDFNVATSDVLVKYTWYGDTDFNGRVNFDDYVRTDNGFNNGLSGWLNGDFDLNGSVNFDDYVLIDLAFNTQDGTLGRALSFLDGSDRSTSGMSGAALQRVATDLGRFGNEYAAHLLSAVPEPGMLSLAGGVASAAMLGRLRRAKGAAKGTGRHR